MAVQQQELEQQPHLQSAYAILLALGLKYKSILKALESFQGVPHRIEQVGTLGSILFVNDSAATIPEAVHFSYAKFRSMAVHLICGGTDKNLKADAMLEEVRHASSISLLDGSFTQNKLLPLPAFVRAGGRASWQDIADGLDLTGHFLLRDILTDRSRPVADARGRLVERLRRAGGLA